MPLVAHSGRSALPRRAGPASSWSGTPGLGWSPGPDLEQKRRLDRQPRRYTRLMSVNVRLPDDLAALLAEEAARQSVTADELAARVLAEHIPARRELGFVAIGASNSGRTAAEAEDMLAEGFGR